MGLDFADVKPSVLSWMLVTIMAITGIVFLRWLNAKVPLGSFGDLIAAV